MKTDTRKNILSLLQKQGVRRPKELAEMLGISPQALHRQLRKLEADGLILKQGKPPRTVYVFCSQKEESSKKTVLHSSDKALLQDRFVQITPGGQLLEGQDAFEHWCKKQSLPLKKTLEEYKQTLKKYDQFVHNNRIDGTEKLQNTFKDVYVDTLYYLDFYSIERFGKTKLGQLMLYAKQSQNTHLMHMVATHCHKSILNVIEEHACNAVCYIPPTVKRLVQFMHTLKNDLQLPLPVVHIDKLQPDIIVPQKSISKLQDRVENASVTMYVPTQQAYNTVLLIDDAVGSGATMNEAAKKLKQAGVCNHIIGVALTGSFRGFEVLNEV